VVAIGLSENFFYDVVAHFFVHDVVALNTYWLIGMGTELPRRKEMFKARIITLATLIVFALGMVAVGDALGGAESLKWRQTLGGIRDTSLFPLFP